MENISSQPCEDGESIFNTNELGPKIDENEEEAGDDLFVDTENLGDEAEHQKDLDVKDEIPGVLKPHVGMMFNSEEDAIQFYSCYAREVGFKARKGGIRGSRKNEDIIGRWLCCSKEGFREERFRKNEASKKVHRAETRIGCPAKFTIIRSEDSKWVVSVFEEKHNHVCEASKKSHFQSVQVRTVDNREVVIDDMSQVGVQTKFMVDYFSRETKGIQSFSSSEKDVKTQLHTKQMRDFNVKDAQALLNYFSGMQLKNPHFFYAIRLDVDGQLTNFFWTDARSKIDYHCFGDVVCIDAAYWKNAYCMPFVPIMGVNNHLQTTLFGCALTLDNTEDSFAWVLETWMNAMKGCHPKGCDFSNNFCQCIQDSGTIEEFELEWEALIAKYNLQEDKWVKRQYDERRKWVLVYSHDIFCAGMPTTQRSECIGKFFKGFLKKNMLPQNFVRAVERALMSQREKEIEANHHTDLRLSSLVIRMYIEEEAATIYTPSVFKKFQEELISSLCYLCEKIAEEGSTSTYRCWMFERENQQHIIEFCSSNSSAKCTCQRFEFMGILCRHILKVYNITNVHKIPQQHIMKRWTRDARCGTLVNAKSEQWQENCLSPLTSRYNSLCQKAMHVAIKGASSAELYKVGMHWLQNAEEVDVAMKREATESIGSSKMDSLVNEREVDYISGQMLVCDQLVADNTGQPRQAKGIYGKDSQVPVASDTGPSSDTPEEEKSTKQHAVNMSFKFPPADSCPTLPTPSFSLSRSYPQGPSSSGIPDSFGNTI